MFKPALLLTAALFPLLSGCGVTGTDTPASAATPATASPQALAARLPPSGTVGWDWQIGAGDRQIKAPAGARLLDVDGFETSAATVAALKAQGVYTVCYINVGSYEPWRPDAAQYPARLKLAQDPDWPDEAFLDVNDVFRSDSALAPILIRRFKMCRDKGFAAIEPDNLLVDEAVPGRVTRQQQLDFNGWIADQAHALGLAILQKNGPDRVLQRDRQGRRMVEVFDGILNEQCQQYAECAPLAEYVRRGKLALNVEYRAGVALDCTQARRLGINLLGRDLGLAAPGTKGYRRTTC